MAWTPKANLRGPAGYNAVGAEQTAQSLADFAKATAGPNAFADALNGMYAPPAFFGGMYHKQNGGWTIGLGDSLTSAGAYQRSHFELMTVLSGQKVARLSNAGVSGDTVQQMLARLDTDVISKRPDRVVFEGLTNNVGLDSAAAKTTYKEILHRLTVAGIAVGLVTIPPRTYATQAHRDQALDYNVFIKAEAAVRGMPVVDTYGALLDGATGNIKAEYTSDGLHLSAAGSKVAAKLEAEAFAKLWPAVSPVYLTTSSADANNLFVNGTMTDVSPVDGVPDGGYVLSNIGGSRATGLLVDDPDFVGKAYEITRLESATGSASISQTKLAGPAYKTGDVLELACKFKPMPGSSLVYNFYAIGSDANNANLVQPHPINAWTLDFDGAAGVAYARFTLPAGITRIQCYMHTASGLGAIRFGQLTMRNRTALGLI